MKNLSLNRKSKVLIILLGYLFIAGIMYLTFQSKSIWYGDDVYYQFQRIQGISKSLKEGLLPSISTINFGEIGYAVNIFYPWITLLPFGIVSLFNGNPISAFYMALFIYFLASLLISHYSMYEFSGSHLQALIFTLIYNFSTYRLIDLLSRAALAEYIATIFLPLCFLGFYETFFRNYHKWYLFALGFGAIILTHVLTTFMTMLIFIVFLLFNFMKIKPFKEHTTALIKAVVTTILITSIYTGPFILEELFQKFPKPDPQILKGLELTKFLKVTMQSNASRFVEGNLYNPGLIVLVILIVGAIYFVKFNSLNKKIYLMGLALFLISTNLFPWNVLQNTPISVIQYPYRLLIFATLFAAVSGSLMITELVRQRDIKIQWGVAALCGILMMGIWFCSFKSATNHTMISDPHGVIDTAMINEDRIPDSYLNQYVPKETLNYLSSVIEHQMYINDKVVKAVPHDNRDTAVLKINKLQKGDDINLPIIRYRLTRVSVNGRPVPFWTSTRGTIEFKAKQSSRNNRIVVSYGSSKLYAGLICLTILGFLIIAGDVFLQKRLKLIEELSI
ncbi:hypothetical protein [Companilactobacillus heilongjiangensis]|uniref:Membrane protein 6-pyruvoyl-tetrahydropterin synthase-related domain-containing protein n=1 Tax=Companilactobacillus heilongjiangensis TaxID=1074467 RepID=A0A0K2LER2_9LACO|nr:hypothetical protein [Companilactobacillus heilongjiangensis]ALB29760.1 hypothetical protein JP39_10575 [Companilactobacillus heilongjiangensis]